MRFGRGRRVAGRRRIVLGAFGRKLRHRQFAQALS
jgi:hypothetical protein